MKKIYTVSQINSYIKNMFTQDYMLRLVYVKGEVSNCKYHSSGHIYFKLKDENGIIACVMFAGDRKGLGFKLEDGQQVVAGGDVNVYERDGKYQLYARQITLDGAGLLYERFEALKRELEEMGMFSSEHKQPDAWRRDGSYRRGCTRHYKRYKTAQSLCADYTLSCDSAGRSGGA